MVWYMKRPNAKLKYIHDGPCVCVRAIAPCVSKLRRVLGENVRHGTYWSDKIGEEDGGQSNVGEDEEETDQSDHVRSEPYW